MKGEAVQKTDMKEQPPAQRRGVMWIGFGAVILLAVSVGLWFGTQHGSHPKSRQHAPMSSMADMPSAPNDDSTDSTAANADLQVELGPDDLKKAQVQTVHTDVKKTSSTLRYTANAKLDDYSQ